MKKFAAALAALLVLSCGTTVLAAPSISSPEAAEKVTASAVDATGKTVEVTVEEGSAELVTEAKAVAQEKSANSTVLAVLDVEVPEGTGKVTITFNVTGVTKADAGKIYLIHEYAKDKWEVIHPSSVEDGKVTATFSSLSPVAICKIAEKAGTTLPKTGAPVVLPVVALICAAGAAGCAKKVKFN